MKIKGVCKNCQYHEIFGYQDRNKYLYCQHRNSRVKNLNIKCCPYFKQQSAFKEKKFKKFYKSNNQIK